MDHKQFYLKTGALIREQRKLHKYTQENLAKQLSISRAAVANIEAGRQQILVHQLYAIAKALEIDLTTLVPTIASEVVVQLVDHVQLPADLTKAQREQILKLIQSANSRLREEIHASPTDKESAR
jgi:transcriptional regulator with XRE-family HTH domain